MSTKALRKELFAAVAMLIVAAIALSGSTYAWFAANTTVTADHMQVTVTSDTTFLLIGQGDELTYSQIQAAKSITTSASITSAALKPTAHSTAAGSAYSVYETDNEWYYKYSLDPATSNVEVTSETALTKASAEGIYYLVNSFSLTVAEGSNQIDNIHVSSCSITTTSDKAVKVLVASTLASEEFDENGGAGSTPLVSSLTSTQTAVIKIFIYWDGNDDDVYTNGIDDLLATDVVVTFTGTPHPAS